MPHLPKFSTEQIIFIISILLFAFIGLPIFFICGCCNNNCKKEKDTYIVSNSKVIKEYP